jgi:hypothetical protein
MTGPLRALAVSGARTLPPFRVHLLAAGQVALHVLGASAAVALLVPMLAGVPIPLPSDLVMLVVGERAAARLSSAASALGSASPRSACGKATALLERWGRPALAIGRGRPGSAPSPWVAAGG